MGDRGQCGHMNRERLHPEADATFHAETHKGQRREGPPMTYYLILITFPSCTSRTCSGSTTSPGWLLL